MKLIMNAIYLYKYFRGTLTGVDWWRSDLPVKFYPRGESLEF